MFAEASAENLRRVSQSSQEESRRTKILAKEVKRRAKRATDRISVLLAVIKDGEEG